MKEKQTTTYVAVDGQEFISKKECEAHEKKLSSMQLWSVTHSPDLNEGRGYYGKTYIRTNDAQRSEVEDFCFNKFGHKSAYVQDARNGYITNWCLSRVDNDHTMCGSTFGLSTGSYDVIRLVWCNSKRKLVVDETYKDAK